jgi:hypothetical protein
MRQFDKSTGSSVESVTQSTEIIATDTRPKLKPDKLTHKASGDANVFKRVRDALLKTYGWDQIMFQRQRSSIKRTKTRFRK